MRRNQQGDGQAIKSDLEGLVAPSALKSLPVPNPIEDVFWVLEENWPAVQLLQACGSQWRLSPDGNIMGLQYEAVDVVIRRGGFEPFSPDHWFRFQTLERTLVKELNK